MKHCTLLSLLLALCCVHIHAAPVEHAGMEQGSCEDASAVSAAGLALTKINQDRKEGYIFSLHHLSNVHMTKHEENGVVFYLTMDVVETNCSILSRKDWKTCEARPTHDTPVYGQCKAAIYINRPHRVVRLYKYDCVIRPVPAAKVAELCPDCPSHIDQANAEVQKTLSLSLDKFNKESGLANRFALLHVSRSRFGMGMMTHYNVEYTIQETTCPRSADATKECPIMDCEFAHKGFCKASLFYSPTGDADTSVECEIYEPEAAEREKKLHLKGDGTDHSHDDTHAHQDHTHSAGQTHGHADHDKTHHHADNSDHHHGHGHSHGHGHGHGHGHDHVHAHHAKAHNHSGDAPNHHHNYKHPDGVHTHDHDHELALDHDHKHAHLHEHEHHHHHHGHAHEITAHNDPEGTVKVLPPMDQPVTMPSIPAPGPEVGVVLPLKPDPEIPGHKEPTIEAFPTSVSSQCTPAKAGDNLVDKIFTEDPMFNSTA